MRNKNLIWIVIIGVIIVLALGGLIQKNYGLFATAGSYSMIRDTPSSVQPNSQFTISYVASGVSGKWGASIVDSVSGGCSFPQGTTLKSVMLSDEGISKTITITAPSSGSCTFSGDYQFGTESIKDFSDSVVTISSSSGEECSGSETKCEGTTYYICSNGYWVSQGQVDGKCGYSSGTSGTECSSGETKCEGTTYYTCSDGYWVSHGQIKGYCGYTEGSFDLDSIIDWLKSNWILVVGIIAVLLIMRIITG